MTRWGWSGVKVLPAQPKQGFAKVQVPGQEGRTQGRSPGGGLWDLIREAQDFPEVTLFPNVNSPGMPNPSLSPHQVRGLPRKHLAHPHGWRDPAQGRGSGKLLTHYVPSTCPPPNPGGLLGLVTPTRCPTREFRAELAWGLGAHLPQGYDEVAGILLFAGKADIVAGDEHLARDVQLVERGPQGTARVAIQALVPGQPERGPVALILGSGVQVSGKAGWGWEERGEESEPVCLPRGPQSLGFHVGLGSLGSSCEQVVPAFSEFNKTHTAHAQGPRDTSVRPAEISQQTACP